MRADPAPALRHDLTVAIATYSPPRTTFVAEAGFIWLDHAAALVLAKNAAEPIGLRPG